VLTKSQVTSCSQCDQPIAPTGLRLPLIEERIYEAVRRRPGITAQELRARVGDTASASTKGLHIHVAQLNSMLAPFRVMVRSQGGGYQIIRDTSHA